MDREVVRLLESQAVETKATARIRIAEARIQNFRLLRELWLPLGDLTVLIGPNNAGKTAFLQALAVALGELRSQVEDLYVGPGSQPKTRSSRRICGTCSPMRYRSHPGAEPSMLLCVPLVSPMSGAVASCSVGAS
jgi:ABC-type molybdenum transport system ATPase subunit/photorepair protein PhrA